MQMSPVPRSTIDALFPRVAEIVADALARPREEVRLDSRLVADLGAESIDFLDIVFRLEQEFEVRIPRGQILESARGDLSEEEFQRDGVLTELGRTRLQAVLDEVPESAFAAPLSVDDIPLLFTVETLCKVLAGAEQQPPSE
ncbi:MAG: acyl carrier protein [Candidatus Binatia bacterium]